jgi:hypothetical protein
VVLFVIRLSRVRWLLLAAQGRRREHAKSWGGQAGIATGEGCESGRNPRCQWLKASSRVPSVTVHFMPLAYRTPQLCMLPACGFKGMDGDLVGTEFDVRARVCWH